MHFVCFFPSFQHNCDDHKQRRAHVVSFMILMENCWLLSSKCRVFLYNFYIFLYIHRRKQSRVPISLEIPRYGTQKLSSHVIFVSRLLLFGRFYDSGWRERGWGYNGRVFVYLLGCFLCRWVFFLYKLMTILSIMFFRNMNTLKGENW